MPVLRILTVALALVATASGCGSSSSTPQVAAAPTTSSSGTAAAASTKASATAVPQDDHGVAWANCMRSHGVNVADPATQGGNIQLLLPKGTDRAKGDAAMKLCQKLLPGGGKLVKADPAQIAQERKMSACMRENGVPQFPDPNADGALMLDSSSGVDPQSPTFVKAQQICAKYMPQGPGGGPQQAPAGK